MTMTTDVLCDLRPSVHGYIDCARLWLRNALSEAELAWLRERCGGAKMRVHDWHAPFDYAFVQRLTLYQPTGEAFDWLARRNDDVLLNYAEIALDWVFGSEENAQEAFHAVSGALVKRHHRDQGIRFVGEYEKFTYYTGPRRAANVIAVYADKACKVTPQPCVHIEWRAKGAAALRRAGIFSIRDLLIFRPFFILAGSLDPVQRRPTHLGPRI